MCTPSTHVCMCIMVCLCVCVCVMCVHGVCEGVLEDVYALCMCVCVCVYVCVLCVSVAFLTLEYKKQL